MDVGFRAAAPCACGYGSGLALSIVRASAGLSQLELAALLGWDQSGVARAEAGTRD